MLFRSPSNFAAGNSARACLSMERKKSFFVSEAIVVQILCKGNDNLSDRILLKPLKSLEERSAASVGGHAQEKCIWEFFLHVGGEIAECFVCDGFVLVEIRL